MARKSAPAAPSAGPQPETVRVHAHRVACDGVGGALGHPRVYLDLGVDGTVDCPYCDRRFVQAGKADGAPGVYEVSGGH